MGTPTVSVMVNARKQTVKDILRTARENPDGFTVSADGLPYRGGGYAVSLTNRTTSGRRLPSAIRGAFAFMADLGQKTHIGGWRDPTGRYFIDNTVILGNKRDALRVARAHDQQAIFNLKTFETINA